MTLSGWMLILVFTAIVIALAKRVGGYLYRRYGDAPLPGERSLYRLAGIDPAKEQSWVGYAAAVLVFNRLGEALVGIVSKSAAPKIDPAGERFDPNFHEAVFEVSSPRHPMIP